MVDKHIQFLQDELKKKQKEIDEIKQIGIADVDTKETIKQRMDKK